VLSLLWAEEAARVATSTQRYALNLFLLPIVYTAVSRREHVGWVAMAFVAGAMGSLLVGFATGGTGVVGDASRLAGGVGDANELAAVLTAAIVLALALGASPGIAPPIRLLALGSAGLALIGILATLSRGGLVALAFALLAGLLFGGRWRGWFALALVVACVAGTSYVAFFAPQAARERVQSTSSTGRSDIWTVGLRMVQAHPVRGVGGGNFPAVSVHYLLRPGVIARDDFIIVTPKVAHNIYLEVQAELGVVGFLLFFGIVGTALAYAMRSARSFKRQRDVGAELLARGVVIATAGVLASDFFVSEQYSKQLWVLLALGPAMLKLARAGEDTAAPA
jgi:O-antigen ligase